MPILGFVPVLHQLCLSFVLSWESHLHQRRAWRFEFGELRLAELLSGILRYVSRVYTHTHASAVAFYDLLAGFHPIFDGI